MDLYLLKNYSNYFNRKVKYRETLDQYLEDRTEGEDYFILPNTNFNPNDGVSTSHIIGSANRPYTPDWQPDYCLVIEWPDGGQPRIVSRWFVTEFVRTMANQYSVALKRDTPCDKYNPLIQAPCYIQKATISEYNPLIVNSEGMNLNQRKVAEYVLRDRSKVPWVVAYIAHNSAKDGIQVNVGLPSNIPDISTDTSDEGQLMREIFLQGGTFTTDSTNVILKDLNSVMAITSFYWPATSIHTLPKTVTLGRRNATQTEIEGTGIQGIVVVDSYSNSKFNDLSQALMLDYSNFWNYIKNQHPEITRSEIVDGDIDRLTRGKIWKYGGNYYELIEEEYNETTKNVYLGVRSQDYLFQKVKTAFQITDETKIGTEGNNFAFYKVKVKNVHYRLQLKTGLTATLDIKASRKHPEEVPYDIIAFPYQPIYVNGTGWNKDIDDVASLAAARSIAIELAEGCYDVQILPYCPVLDQFIDSDGNISLYDAVENVDYCVVKKTEGGVTTNYTLGFYCNTAYQSLTGANAITNMVDTQTGKEITISAICRISPDGRKVDNECDTWRLCAPNWTSQFEFKMTKVLDLVEGAEMNHFDVDITYRPYQPYIRVAPQFDFLYVTNYNDARGLICTTGFSITLIDDKWQTYELNNKNYQSIFNRELQGMEVNRGIAREQEQWNISQAIASASSGIFGALGRAGMGMLGGALVGGPVGAAMGLGAGSFGIISSSINAGMNIANAKKQASWAERAYQENRDMKLDMFNMSLDNIKALPSSITQSSSISYNFKFYPVLEKYSCTDEERQMVKDKIKWNGMTVGLIGTIERYISSTEERYIQGELIRLEDLDEDSHLANDLYSEVKKGLFFEPYIPINKEVK